MSTQRWFVFLLLASFSLPLAAFSQSFSPMLGRRFLVTGMHLGYADGAFDKAAFASPMGLALSKDGNELYVADRDNHAIRGVRMDASLSVRTVFGNGHAGASDGVAGGLSKPTEILSMDDGKLLILEQDGHRLRLGDLATGELRSLSSTGQGAWSQIEALDGTRALALDHGSGTLDLVDTRSGQIRRLAQGAPLLGGNALIYVDQGVVTEYRSDIGSFGVLTAGAASFSPIAAADVTPVVLVGLRPYATNLTGCGQVIPFHGLGWQPGSVLAWSDATGAFRLFSPITGQIRDIRLYDFKGDAFDSGGFPRRFLKNFHQMVYEPNHGLIFASEPDHGMVVALRMEDNSVSDSGLMLVRDLRPARVPVPGVERVLFVGDSMLFRYGGEQSGDAPQVTFSHMFEDYFNLLASVRNSDARRIETFNGGRELKETSAGAMTLFRRHAKTLEPLGARKVVLLLDAFGLLQEAAAYQCGPTPDDMGDGDYHPDFVMQDAKERQKAIGPLARDLASYVEANQRRLSDQIKVSSTGNWQLTGFGRGDLLRDEGFRQRVLRIIEKNLRVAKAAAQAQGADLWAFIVPMRQDVAPSEMEYPGGMPDNRPNDPLFREELLGAIARADVPVLDISDEMRLADPTFFPLYVPGDHHLNPEGHRLAGLLFAEKALSNPRWCRPQAPAEEAPSAGPVALSSTSR